MGVLGREWGPVLLRELNRRAITDSGSATVIGAGAAVGLDSFDAVIAVTWLIQERLVQTQTDLDMIPDPYTHEALEPTEAGRAYLEAHPF